MFQCIILRFRRQFLPPSFWPREQWPLYTCQWLQAYLSSPLSTEVSQDLFCKCPGTTGQRRSRGGPPWEDGHRFCWDICNCMQGYNMLWGIYNILNYLVSKIVVEDCIQFQMESMIGMGDLNNFLFDPIPSTFKTSIVDINTDTSMKYFWLSNFILHSESYRY